LFSKLQKEPKYVFWLLFPRKSMNLVWQNTNWATFWAIFFTTSSSGHTACRAHVFISPTLLSLYKTLSYRFRIH
jgi:hypothetical protein